MILKITSDAPYLVQPKAHSCAAAVVQLHITTLAGSTATEPMDPSTSCAKQSKMLSPQQQKPKPEASKWAENMLAQWVLPSKNSATPNPSPDPLLRQTTALQVPKASSLPKCAK
jgi:hypothetical protein